LSQAGIEVVQDDLEAPASTSRQRGNVSSVILVSFAVPTQEVNVVDSAARAGVTTS
jgi:hypothetical protein